MAFDPITGLALGAQAGTGIYQMYKGAKLAKEAEAAQQDYVIPQEIYNTLTDAQIQSMEGLPAAQKAQFIQNIQGSTQVGLNALSDRKAGVSGVEGILRNEQGAFGDLLAQDSVARQNNQANLQGVRNNMAGFKDKQFDMNVFQPYMAKLQASEAMKGAGMQNVMGTLQSGAGMSQDYNLLQDILGSNNIPGSNVNPAASGAASGVLGAINNIPQPQVGMVNQPFGFENNYNSLLDSYYKNNITG